MALPLLTLPLDQLKKFKVPYIGVGLSLLDYLLDEGAAEPEEDDTVEWRRFVIEYTRSTPTGTVEDKAQFGIDILNVTDGVVDPTWTEGDHIAAHNLIYAFLNTIKSVMTSTGAVTAIKAYRRQFAAAPTIERRFEDSGAPVWQAAPTLAGTSTANVLPYQVAMSCTLKTAAPRHWGRFYLPGLTEDAVTADGRWDAADVSTVSVALGTLLQGLWDAQLPAVVATTQVNSVLTSMLLSVTGGQVDDIPDVIRRRRPRQPAFRTLSPIV